MDKSDLLQNAVDSSVVACAEEDVHVFFDGVDVLPAVGEGEGYYVAACAGEDVY